VCVCGWVCVCDKESVAGSCVSDCEWEREMMCVRARRVGVDTMIRCVVDLSHYSVWLTARGACCGGGGRFDAGRMHPVIRWQLTRCHIRRPSPLTIIITTVIHAQSMPLGECLEATALRKPPTLSMQWRESAILWGRPQPSLRQGTTLHQRFR
jgi:hypothetical protein